MKQTLPDIIRENKDLLQALLKQEGGIVSYLAGHLDADGREALYEGYRAQCLEAYREENKWSMGEVMMERMALGDGHIKKELACQVALRPILSGFPNAEGPVLSFIADYMDYAFRKSHTELYPTNVVNDQKFYEQVIIQYMDKVFGRAHRCLWLVLNEYRGKAKIEKDELELWIEFELQKYSQVYRSGEEKLRRAVKEIIDEKTKGKGEEECRQICRKEAKDVMKRLWSFTRLVNGDDDILELHLKENPRLYETWSSKDLELGGASVSFIEKQKKYISKEEKVWLREGMMVSPMQNTFRQYCRVLEEIGNIWADQLKEYGINIRELEEETGCILNKRGFYVERSLGGSFGKFYMPPPPINEQDQADGQQGNTNSDTICQKEGRYNGAGLPDRPLPVVFQDNLLCDEIAKKLLHIEHFGLGSKQFAQVVEDFFKEIGWAADVPSTKFVEWMNGKGIIRTNNTTAPRMTKNEKGFALNSAKLKDALKDAFQNINGVGIWEDRGEFYRKDSLKINNGKLKPK